MHLFQLIFLSLISITIMFLGSHNSRNIHIDVSIQYSDSYKN